MYLFVVNSFSFIIIFFSIIFFTKYFMVYFYFVFSSTFHQLMFILYLQFHPFMSILQPPSGSFLCFNWQKALKDIEHRQAELVHIKQRSKHLINDLEAFNSLSSTLDGGNNEREKRDLLASINDQFDTIVALFPLDDPSNLRLQVSVVNSLPQFVFVFNNNQKNNVHLSST